MDISPQVAVNNNKNREREEKYGIEDLWSQEEVALDPVEVREYEGNHRYFPHFYVFSSFLISPFFEVR